MSEERIDKLEKSLQVMRKRVDEVDRGQRAELAGLRYALFACAIAGAMLALTAATWRTTHETDDHVGEVTTLWGMVPEGWQAVVTFALVLVVAVGTLAVFLADTAGRPTHLVFAGLCLLTVVAIFLVGAVEPAGWYDPEDGHAGPARWLTALAAVVLGITHASRAAEVDR
jgi:Mn2+/Fe2+ NRAMP family transporter